MASCGFISGLVLLFVGLVAFKLIRRLVWCRRGGGSGGCGGGGGWHGWRHRHHHHDHDCHQHDCHQHDYHDHSHGHPYRGESFDHDHDSAQHGFGPEGPWPRSRRGWQRGAAFVASRLGATPEQRDALERAAREMHDAVQEQKPELSKTRSDIADALRDADFDAERMGELFARHDVALESVRKAFVGAMAQVHDALDPDQRAKLARFITRGR
ncbi:MAG: periplasmic heavy metal sensor [Myxococcales bacterium]|nr:periplasmic heavy metal sensor [Myxococcales bacterium]